MELEDMDINSDIEFAHEEDDEDDDDYWSKISWYSDFESTAVQKGKLFRLPTSLTFWFSTPPSFFPIYYAVHDHVRQL